MTTLSDTFAAVTEAIETAFKEADKAAMTAIVADGGEVMLEEPWRITRVLRPYAPSYWPIPGRTPDETLSVESVLGECRRALAAEERRQLERSWLFDGNRLIALRQAEWALERMEV